MITIYHLYTGSVSYHRLQENNKIKWLLTLAQRWATGTAPRANIQYTKLCIYTSKIVTFSPSRPFFSKVFIKSPYWHRELNLWLKTILPSSRLYNKKRLRTQTSLWYACIICMCYFSRARIIIEHFKENHLAAYLFSATGKKRLIKLVL